MCSTITTCCLNDIPHLNVYYCGMGFVLCTFHMANLKFPRQLSETRWLGEYGSLQTLWLWCVIDLRLLLAITCWCLFVVVFCTLPSPLFKPSQQQWFLWSNMDDLTVIDWYTIALTVNVLSVHIMTDLTVLYQHVISLTILESFFHIRQSCALFLLLAA